MIQLTWYNWHDTTHFDSEDDYRTGCRNVSHCQQQQSYSGLRSPKQSNSTNFWNLLFLLFFAICASKCLTKFSYDHFLLKLQKNWHQSAPNFTKLLQTVPCCTNLHQVVPNYTNLHQHAVHQDSANCTNLHHIAPVWTKLHQTRAAQTHVMRKECKVIYLP